MRSGCVIFGRRSRYLLLGSLIRSNWERWEDCGEATLGVVTRDGVGRGWECSWKGGTGGGEGAVARLSLLSLIDLAEALLSLSRRAL